MLLYSVKYIKAKNLYPVAILKIKKFQAVNEMMVFIFIDKNFTPFSWTVQMLTYFIKLHCFIIQNQGESPGHSQRTLILFVDIEQAGHLSRCILIINL